MNRSLDPWEVSSKIGPMRKIRIWWISGILVFVALAVVMERVEAGNPPARPAHYKNPYPLSTPAKAPVTTIRFSGTA